MCQSLTKPEVRHPYYIVPYKSLPESMSRDNDGKTPLLRAVEELQGIEMYKTIEMLVKQARSDIDQMVRINLFNLSFN